MSDTPEHKSPEDKKTEETPATRLDGTLDAEYLSDEEEQEIAAPETWPELGADEEPATKGYDATVAEAPAGSLEDRDSAEGAEEADVEPVAATAAPAAKPTSLRWDMLFLLLLTSITLVRLGYLYIVPLDLGPNESYYWDWSRHLDLGYFSQPPMIAWVNATSTALLGLSTQAVRMPAVVFGTLGLIGMYLCGRRMYNAEVAFWGVAAWLATPESAALALLMETNALLLSFWCLSLYTLWRALQSEKAKAFWWLLTILLVGLGSLSQLMMLSFPLLLVIYLLLSEDRKLLLSRWPWLMWFGSLLFLIPMLWWNFQHDWVTFKQTAHLLEPVGNTPLEQSKNLAKFVGGQLVLLTPITWLLLLLLSVGLLLKLLRWSRQTSFLYIFGVFGLLMFYVFSFRQGINPNWPATFYPAALLLLAAWGKEQLSAGFFDGLRSWFPRGLKLGIALTLLAYLAPLALQIGFIPLGDKDLTGPFKGWRKLGQQVGEILQQQPRPGETFVVSPLQKYPSAVAFYGPGNPATYKWPGNPPQFSSQYELWPGPIDKLGWDALILHNADTPLPAELAASFENIVELGEQRIPIGAAGERKYIAWRGENLLNWPERN